MSHTQPVNRPEASFTIRVVMPLNSNGDYGIGHLMTATAFMDDNGNAAREMLRDALREQRSVQFGIKYLIKLVSLEMEQRG